MVLEFRNFPELSGTSNRVFRVLRGLEIRPRKKSHRKRIDKKFSSPDEKKCYTFQQHLLRIPADALLITPVSQAQILAG